MKNKQLKNHKSAKILIFSFFLRSFLRYFSTEVCKSLRKNVENGKILTSCYFWDHFRSFWDPFSQSQRTSTNAYRMKLNLIELNSMGDTIQSEYKFGTWQVFQKAVNFLHVEYGRKIVHSTTTTKIDSNFFVIMRDIIPKNVWSRALA